MSLLTNEQIKDFFDVGFIIVPNLFRSDEISKMQAAFDRLQLEANLIRTTQTHKGSYFVLGEKKSQTVIHRIVWCGACEKYLLEVSADSRLTAPAGQLLGSRTMEQLINQAHFKLPGDGVAFPWHQDIQHRQKGENDWRDLNGKGSYVQSILLLDDMTTENGPVMFIPGSHKKGRMDLGGDGYDTPTRDDLVDAKLAVPAIGAAGSVVFFGPYTVHGSFANTGKTTRRVLINGYAYPGANARVYPGEGSCRKLTVDAAV
jgi:ectoine hydroxylase-related dioxygenase (phytanoyl-CoA dioxygenase family)